MKINPRQIEIFRELIMSGTATAAARVLRTSQPTISRQLKELEEQLGFQLFEREKGRLIPTDEALSLSVVVEHAFVGLEEIARSANVIRNHSLEHISVACLPAFAHALLPAACHVFSQHHPNVRITIHSAQEPTLHKDFFSRRFSIGLVELPYQAEGVIVEELRVGDLVCVLPKNHPLAAKTVLVPQDFENVGFISYNDEDPYRRKLDNIFAAENVSRRLNIETVTAVGICAMVQSGLGVSIINPLTALAFRGQGIELRRFSISVPYDIRMLKSQKSLQLDLIEKFIGEIHRVIATCREALLEQGLTTA